MASARIDHAGPHLHNLAILIFRKSPLPVDLRSGSRRGRAPKPSNSDWSTCLKSYPISNDHWISFPSWSKESRFCCVRVKGYWNQVVNCVLTLMHWRMKPEKSQKTTVPNHVLSSQSGMVFPGRSEFEVITTESDDRCKQLTNQKTKGTWKQRSTVIMQYLRVMNQEPRSISSLGNCSIVLMKSLQHANGTIRQLNWIRITLRHAPVWDACWWRPARLIWQSQHSAALFHFTKITPTCITIWQEYDDSGREIESKYHWQRFLELSPDSPWAEEAIARLHSIEQS